MLTEVHGVAVCPAFRGRENCRPDLATTISFVRELSMAEVLRTSQKSKKRLQATVSCKQSLELT